MYSFVLYTFHFGLSKNFISVYVLYEGVYILWMCGFVLTDYIKFIYT